MFYFLVTIREIAAQILDFKGIDADDAASVNALIQENYRFLCAVLACEAGGSIKPGAPAPGSKHNRFFKPRECGR